MAADRIIRLPELRRILGNVSAATVYRWTAAGRLPRRVRVGENVSGWRESEVAAFLASLPPAGVADAAFQQAKAAASASRSKRRTARGAAAEVR